MNRLEKNLSQKIIMKTKGANEFFRIKWLISIWTLIFVIYPSHLWATQINDQLHIDGEVRLRYELMDGFNDKIYGETPAVGESHDGYLLSRVRLSMIYSFTPSLIFKISMQDARTIDWGFSDTGWYSKEFGIENNPQKDFLELYHTYIQASNIGGSPFTLTLGRQKIAYGDMRIFGPGEWKNSGKWIWDALKLSCSKGKYFIDLFYGATMLHDPGEFSLSHRWGYEGFGIYAHYAWETGAIEPVLVYKHNDNGNDSYHSLTHYYTGVRLYDDIGKISYNATYIRQFGEQVSIGGIKSDVDAYGWHLDTGYNFMLGSIKMKTGAGYSYASGDDSSTPEIERFDGIFGASDKYYGRMNLMSCSNLKDAELFIIVSPLKNINVKIEYHRFKLANKSDKWRSYRNQTGVNEDDLGSEIDVVFEYDIKKNIKFQTGFGHFNPGYFIKKNVPAHNLSDWCFIQSTILF
ncbi:MAG: alginate export family protein [Deltaproteobacteria bacterium]|nr:alginate export family protein [Deltaproteobacteria bacterium]